MARSAFCLILFSVAGVLTLNAVAQAPSTKSIPPGPRPMLQGSMERPLRYAPAGTDFVITNGGEFFNRPLYGNHDAFRVDAGDMPEFSLYLPGRGGNLRIGVKTPGGVKWLNECDEIVARYRPGS